MSKKYQRREPPGDPIMEREAHICCNCRRWAQLAFDPVDPSTGPCIWPEVFFNPSTTGEKRIPTPQWFTANGPRMKPNEGLQCETFLPRWSPEEFARRVDARMEQEPVKPENSLRHRTEQ